MELETRTRKLCLEVEKLKKELNQLTEPNDFEKAISRFKADIDKRNASNVFRRLESRLNSNPSKLKDLSVGFVNTRVGEN